MSLAHARARPCRWLVGAGYWYQFRSLNHMPGQHGICVFDPNRVITHVNRAAEEIVRLPIGDALGRDVREVFPFIPFDISGALSRNGSDTHEASIEQPDGGSTWVSYAATPTTDGGGVIAIRELTSRERATEELVESERQSRLLFDQNPFPMCVYDVATLCFLDVNPSAIHHYGYSRSEFLSMTLADIRPEEDVPAVLDAVHQNANAFRAEGRWRHRRKDGRIITVDVTSTATTYQKRRAKLAVIHDVTDVEESEAKAREATALIDAIVNTVPLGIWGVDLAGHVNFWNRKAEDLFGWNENEVLGSRMSFASANDEVQLDPSPAHTARESGAGFEQALRCRDGRVLYCDVWRAPLRDGFGNRTGTIAVAADTTERKRAQKQVAKYVRSLARSNDDLKQFANAASHDLQEPLRNIRLFTELLAQIEPANGDARAQECHTHILQGAKQIQDLIRGLRKYWELGEQLTALTTNIQASALLAKVLASFEQTVRDVGASVRYDMPAVLSGNEEDLRTVLEELLTNAIRFRAQRPLTIEISAQIFRPGTIAADDEDAPVMGENGNAWEICVQDNGIGIAPAYATKIFGIFKRLSRGNEGIGLGLALVKRIVERHGGRVWVESEEGQGSRFCFIWPGASKL